VVVVALNHLLEPSIEALGLPLVEDYPDFVEEAKADIARAIDKLKRGSRRDPAEIAEAARLAARRAAQRWSGKRPQVRVMLLGS